MNELAADPEMRASLGIAGRSLARTRFSLDRFERDLVALYDGLLNEKRG
jgi:hypothetical protein